MAAALARVGTSYVELLALALADPWYEFSSLFSAVRSPVTAGAMSWCPIQVLWVRTRERPMGRPLTAMRALRRSPVWTANA